MLPECRSRRRVPGTRIKVHSWGSSVQKRMDTQVFVSPLPNCIINLSLVQSVSVAGVPGRDPPLPLIPSNRRTEQISVFVKKKKIEKLLCRNVGCRFKPGLILTDSLTSQPPLCPFPSARMLSLKNLWGEREKK